MYHSSPEFLVEVTFNLTLVDESVWTMDSTWKSNVLELILSTCSWSPTPFSRLSFQPFPSQNNEARELISNDKFITSSPPSPTPFKRTSSIVRGRDVPFPVIPPSRRLSLAPTSDISTNTLLQRRYSSTTVRVLPDTDLMPSRGRTLQRNRPSLYLSDSRTVIIPETSEEEVTPPRGTSRNSTLLRVPPFPLPHRLLRRPVSQSPARKNSGMRPISERMSSIPPPLVLESMFSYGADDADEDSPVLGKEEFRRQRQRSVSRR